MRFETRFDRWLVVVLVITAAITGVVLPVMFLRLHFQLWLAFTLPLLWLMVLAATLPQYYELREDGLFLRQGWRKNLIPYASLSEIQSVSAVISAGVFSIHRLLIFARPGKRFLIAVADEKRFRDELAKRLPPRSPITAAKNKSTLTSQ